MTKVVLQLRLHGSGLVPLSVSVLERRVLQHRLDAICHEITLGVGTKQPRLVVLPDVGIHCCWIVCVVSTMWAKHVLQICLSRRAGTI